MQLVGVAVPEYFFTSPKKCDSATDLMLGTYAVPGHDACRCTLQRVTPRAEFEGAGLSASLVRVSVSSSAGRSAYLWQL